MLPAGVVWVGLGQALSDGEVVAEEFQSLRQIALHHHYVADVFVSYWQITLPDRVVWVGLGQALSDGEGPAEQFQRFRQVSLRHQHVADLVVVHRQIPLLKRLVGSRLRQALDHLLPRKVLGQCTSQVALGEKKIAIPLVGKTQFESPFDIVGFLLDQIGHQTSRFDRPLFPILDLPKAPIVVSECTQHDGLAIRKLRC